MKDRNLARWCHHRNTTDPLYFGSREGSQDGTAATTGLGDVRRLLTRASLLPHYAAATWGKRLTPAALTWRCGWLSRSR